MEVARSWIQTFGRTGNHLLVLTCSQHVYLPELAGCQAIEQHIPVLDETALCIFHPNKHLSNQLHILKGDIYLFINEEKAPPAVKCIQSGRHRVDRIAGALKESTVKIQKIDRNRHPNLLWSCWKQAMAYEGLGEMLA